MCFLVFVVSLAVSNFDYHHYYSFELSCFKLHKIYFNFYFLQGMFSDLFPLICGTSSTLKYILMHLCLHSLNATIQLWLHTPTILTMAILSFMSSISFVELNFYQL